MRLVSVLAILALSACSHGVQTTSGKSYLSSYPGALDTPTRATQPIYASTSTGDIIERELPPSDAELIREAASVEPLLRFPARFGLAKLENGRLSAIGNDEAGLWRAFAADHAKLGEFIPVNPVLAEFTSNSVQRRYATESRAADAATKIRLGAARQHLDAVLIYEVGLSSRNDNTALAFADLTILGGAFLPTRDLKASGTATALLIDVRNGYPYGTATAQTDLSELSTSWGSDAREDALRKTARREVVADLIPEVSAMFSDLVLELSMKRKPGLPAS